MIELTIKQTRGRDKFSYSTKFKLECLQKRKGVHKLIINRLVPFLYKTLKAILDR